MAGSDPGGTAVVQIQAEAKIVLGVQTGPLLSGVIIIIIIWFVRLLALRPLLAYCASLG
jgi:hypothetical protein